MGTESKAMNYIRINTDGQQTDIIEDYYYLRGLIMRGWAVVGILEDAETGKHRYIVARPFDVAHAERDAALAAAQAAECKAESALYETKQKLDAAITRIGELTQQLAEATEATKALAPHFDTEV